MWAEILSNVVFREHNNRVANTVQNGALITENFGPHATQMLSITSHC